MYASAWRAAPSSLHPSRTKPSRISVSPSGQTSMPSSRHPTSSSLVIDRRAKHDLAVDERQNGRDVLEALFRARQHVVGEHDENSPLAGMERPKPAFLPSPVG